MKLSGQERILVLKPSSLGDIVHSLPAVAAIRRQFPETRIDWLVNTEWQPLLEGASFLERTLPFPRREFRGIGGSLRARRWARDTFRDSRYDLAIDLQGLLRSALLARMSGARHRVGYRQAREGASWLYDEAIDLPDWSRLHAVDRYRKLVENLGVTTDPVEFPLPEGKPVELPEGFSEAPLVLHPFSRGAGKSLSVDEVRELCEALSPRPVLLVGRTDGSLSHEWPENVLDLLDRTDLDELIFLLRLADWTISVDSGPMHLAAGISNRVLSLHTWTNPAVVGPWQPRAWIYRDGELVQVREIGPEQFPEQRERKKELAARDRLYEPDEIERIAKFFSTPSSP